MREKSLISVFLVIDLLVVAHTWADITVHIEPTTLFINTPGNVVTLVADNPDHEFGALHLEVLFDTNCFSVTAVNKTERSTGMDIFTYSHISDGIWIMMIGIGYDIGPGIGPVVDIIVDVGGCAEGDYLWDITDCSCGGALICDCTCIEKDTELNVRYREYDVNGDGGIDVRDITAIINHMLRIDVLLESEFERADWNIDSLINVLDVVGIVKEILGLKNQYRAYAHGFWEAVASDTLGDYGSGLLDCNWYAIDTKSSPDSVLVTWEEEVLCPTKSGVMNSSGEFFIDDGRFPEEGATTAEFKILSDKKALVKFYVFLHSFDHIYEKTLMKTRDDPTVYCF